VGTVATATVAFTGLALTTGGAVAAEPLPPSPGVVVAKMTGPNAITPTNTNALGNIAGTDLGAFWDAGNGTVIAAFGDTYNRETTSGQWRCSSGLISSDTDLSDGVSWDSAIKVNPEDQYSAQLVPCNKDAGGNGAVKPGEHSAIPTGGFAVQNPAEPTEYRNFVGYMSNTGFGAAGYWGIQYSEIYYSDDYGLTWAQAPLKWVNTSGSSNNYHPFSMINFAQQPGDPWVYMFGTGGGRHTPVAVARVQAADFYAMDQSKFEYWITDSWVGTDEDPQADSHATPVMGNFTDHGVGELGIGYDQWTQSWVSFHQDNDLSIVLQTAPAPTGPWTDPEIVVHVDDYPQLYGGFIHPWSLGDDPDLYFSMSDWNKYNTFLVRVTLNRDGSLARPNLVTDPNFERSPLAGSTASFSSAWQNDAEAAGIDRATSQASGGNRPYSGWHSAWMRLGGETPAGDVSLFQTIDVKPNTDYRAWGEVKYNDDTANTTAGPAVETAHFGIRQLDGEVLVQTDINKTCTNPAAVVGDANCGSNATFYARQDVTFNSGDNTQIQIFVGGPRQEANPYMNIDTFGLLELAPTNVDRAELAAAVGEAETKDPAEYTTGSATAFLAALATARATLGAALAAQGEVDQAATDLVAATEALVLASTVPELQVTVTPRCGAGKAQVSVTVRNSEDTTGAAEVAISSPLGATKSFASVAPGKSASNAFTTRLAVLEAGTVTVTGKLLPEGGTTTETVGYAGVDCR
jgi:hypothetical protein